MPSPFLCREGVSHFKIFSENEEVDGNWFLQQFLNRMKSNKILKSKK